jgi:hypothetical protein
MNDHFAHDDSDLREGRYQSAAYDRYAVDGTGTVSRLRGLLREYLKLRGARFGVYGITLAAAMSRGRFGDTARWRVRNSWTQRHVRTGAIVVPD